MGDPWSVSVFIPDDQLPSTQNNSILVYSKFNGVLNFAGLSIALGDRPAANGGTVLSLTDASNGDKFNVGARIANEPRDLVDGYELYNFGVDLYDPTIFTDPSNPPQFDDLLGLGVDDFRAGSLFIVYAIIDGDPFNDLWLGEVDFLQAQVVPVPAAFWLFASGLGALGWFSKRKSTAQWRLRNPQIQAGAINC